MFLCGWVISLLSVHKLEGGSCIWSLSPSTTLSENKGERQQERKIGKDRELKEGERKESE